MSYIHSADQSTTTTTALIDKPIVPIPANLFSYLQRRPDGSANMLNFPMLAKLLSINDLTNYAKCVDNTFILPGCPIATKSFHELMAPSIPQADTESMELLDSICASYKVYETTSAVVPGANDKAEFKMLANALFITIPPNFVASIWSYKNDRTEFVRKYIENAYTVLGDARVHSPDFGVFGLYITGMPLLAE